MLGEPLSFTGKSLETRGSELNTNMVGLFILRDVAVHFARRHVRIKVWAVSASSIYTATKAGLMHAERARRCRAHRGDCLNLSETRSGDTHLDKQA